MKKLLINVVIISLFFVFYLQKSYAEDLPLKTAGFNIEDAVFLNALAEYDKNADCILTFEEMESISTLVLDGLPIKSLKGIENFNIVSLSADGCNLENLDGIRDIKTLKNLSLSDNEISELGELTNLELNKFSIKNNNLSDVEEFKKILDTGAKYIYISGNPFYEEAREYYFYNVDTKLTIVGKPGDVVWQKYGSEALTVDIGNAIGKNDFNMDSDDIEFSIENQEIAKLAEDAFLVSLDKKNVSIVSLEYDYNEIYLRDRIAKVTLLAPGHTKMIISCGEYEKAVDIWVVEDREGTPFITDVKLSDQGLAKVFSSCPTTLSGITTKALLLDNISNVYVKGEYNVTDISSFTDLENIEEVTISGYNQEQFDQLIGINVVENMRVLHFRDNEIKRLLLEDDFANLETLFVKGNSIEEVSISGKNALLSKVDLRGNNISDVNNIYIPVSVKELYVNDNPLPVDSDEILFEKYMFTEDISGAPEDIYEAMFIDIVVLDDIKFEVEDESIINTDGLKLKLLRAGTTSVKVNYKSVEKVINVVVERDSYKYGDINYDGVICAEDALLVLKHAAKLETIADDTITVADVTQDGAVNSEDALEILKYAAILINEF